MIISAPISLGELIDKISILLIKREKITDESKNNHISNELNNGQQLGFVTELLSRVGMSPQDAYSGTQDEFREAIMYEYRFEVLGEGEDDHNNRRRGFDYFLNKTILFHNNNPNYYMEINVKLYKGQN